MQLKHGFILLIFLVAGGRVLAQDNPAVLSAAEFRTEIAGGLSNRYLVIGDSIFILFSACKNTNVMEFKTLSYVFVKPEIHRLADTIQFVNAARPKNPLLKVHGNIMYNFSYRSFIDTPFTQNDLAQHLIQSYFDFVVKDKYPVRMIVSGRSSNSPYFKDRIDLSFQFNRTQLLDNVKADLRSQLPVWNSDLVSLAEKAAKLGRQDLSFAQLQQLIPLDQLKQYQEELKAAQGQVQSLQSWMNHPGRLQQLVEEQERSLRTRPDVDYQASKDGDMPANIPFVQRAGVFAAKAGSNVKNRIGTEADSFKKKLPVESVTARIDTVRKQIDKLTDTIKRLENRVRKEQKKILDSVNALRKEINAITTTAGLFAFMRKHNIAKDQLTKTQRLLLAVNKVGIGRTWLDHSELTVKNISIAGVNIEMNPGPFYVAFATGKVNYRFRDFIYKDGTDKLPAQSVTLVRAGVGQKEKNNFILSYYQGKKAVLNPSTATAYNAIQRLMGISAEMRLALNTDNYLVLEFAKSSYYSNTAQQPSRAELSQKTFNFSERGNEAYSIRFFSQHPVADLKITGYYKKLGRNFQSFTLFPTGIGQDAWLLRANKQFWKKRIMVDAAIRKNDFGGSPAVPSLYSRAVFKSILVTARVPRYPFVSVGFYPVSQLLADSRGVLAETQYNTLNAIINYSYTTRNKLSMNTGVAYTRFFNNSSDTGFVYYNAYSLTLSHAFFFSKLQSQTGLTITKQYQLNLFTLEQSLLYAYRHWFSVRAGLKWTRDDKRQNMFGPSVAATVNIGKIGTIQASYDKVYLPGFNRNLQGVDMGNLTFYRNF